MAKDQTPDVDGAKETTQDQQPEIQKPEDTGNSEKKHGDLSVALKEEREKRKALQEEIERIKAEKEETKKAELTADQRINQLEKKIFAQKLTSDEWLQSQLMLGNPTEEEMEQRFKQFSEKYYTNEKHQKELEEKDKYITELEEKLKNAGKFETIRGSKNPKDNEKTTTLTEKLSKLEWK